MKKAFKDQPGLIRDVCLFFFTILLNLSGDAIAQNSHRTDSLLADLAKDTSSVKLNRQVGNSYLPANLDSSLYYLEKALKFLENGDKGRYYFQVLDDLLGVVALQQEEASYLNQLEEYIQLAAEHGDSVDMAQGYIRKGRGLDDLGRIAEAITAFYAGIRIAEAIQDTTNMGNGMLRLGYAMDNMGDRKSALTWFNRAIEVLNEDDSLQLRSLVLAYNNKGSVLNTLGRHKEAMASFRWGIELNNGLTDRNDKENQGLMLFNIGETHLFLEQYGQARNAFQQVKEIADSLKTLYVRSLVEEGFGKYYASINQGSMASAYFQRALDLTMADSSLPDTYYLVQELATWYKKLGQYKEALEYTERSIALRDSLFSLEKTRSIQTVALTYQMERQATENKLLREQEARVLQRENSILIGALGIVIFLLVLAGILLVANRRRKRTNNLLETNNRIIGEKNEALQKLNNEKEALMGIVAHDLKAPLNKTEGLMNILEMSGDINQEQKGILDKMKQVLLHGMNLIEDLVMVSQVEDSKEPIQVKEVNMNEVVSGVLQTFTGASEAKSISLELKVPESKALLLTHKEYVERILDNLISNALKFSKEGTRIAVSLSREPEEVKVAVQDQGPGIRPEEMKKLFHRFSKLSSRPTAGESSSGLGLYIVKVLADTLGARVEVATEMGVGSTFTLTLPAK